MITAALSHCEIKIVVRLPSRRFQAAASASRRVCIQAFVMNVFGSIDNLAWIWVSKKRLDVHHNSVGLIPKARPPGKPSRWRCRAVSINWGHGSNT
jgi:hypothetical protein